MAVHPSQDTELSSSGLLHLVPKHSTAVHMATSCVVMQFDCARVTVTGLDILHHVRGGIDRARDHTETHLRTLSI